MARIMVIDDEPLICEMLQVVLSRAGHDVLTASNGIEALHLIGEDGAVELVIADIVMPEMDGLETIVQLRKRHPGLKVIAISGGSRIGNADFLAMAERLGASETFYKPLDNDELLVAIGRCLNDSERDGS